METKLNGASLAERRPLPDYVAQNMKHYNNGFVWGVPASYVNFHEKLAEEVLVALVEAHKLRVVEKTVKDDGWLDGMKTLAAVVEDRYGRVHKLVWCDSNQGFMEQLRAGQGSFDPAELFGL